MSLRIYGTIQDAKSAGLNVVVLNDVYFDTNTSIPDTAIARRVLELVEKAKYYSSNIFTDRSGYNLRKGNLSTGTKTLLNIISHPDMCFDISECGRNVIIEILGLDIGNIVWGKAHIVYDGDEYCDVFYNNKEYRNIYDLLDALMEV